MAYVGFIATLADGSEVRESDGTWDSVPDSGIARLALVAFHEERNVETGETRTRREMLAFLDGAPGRRFFFYNEAAAGRGGMGFLTAKGIGYLDEERAVELRFDIMPGRAAYALRGALSALAQATQFTRKLVRMFSLRRRTLIGEALDVAEKVRQETQNEPRTVWLSYPPSRFRFHTNTLRRAA